ncbi:queuosine precursor transporter [Corynebacterium anserum]|uniref:Probable queuosine precursor transporter n=1 Tax=Corynebacterium anserum TaxID=2684406 RepID=A0A7G7YM45_9CORY|nr:queuosine precursor transporter [Corynebacterium anserum]MBC2681255.1 queuosine precursor transporter [Corynebacterium anserum]QNH95565.1 queuosine precursor transporter [Corynebacterium anserum]
MTTGKNLPLSGPGNAEAAAAHASHAPAHTESSAAAPNNAAKNSTVSNATGAAAQPTDSTPRHIHVPRTLYPIFVAVFIGVLIVSNITATKGVAIGPLVTDGAFFLFPLSYVIGDVLSECYGYKATRNAVWAGFAILALAMLCFFIAIKLPPAEFYDNQAAFETVLGTVPQLVLAGLAGYIFGQLLNAWSLNVIKKHTGEKALWARLMGSTIVGEFVDTLIFCSIAATAIGIDSWGAFINYVVVGFFWKTFVEFCVMPITYAVIAWVKKNEGYYEQPSVMPARPSTTT